MAETKFRLNKETEEVELVFDGEVALTVDKEIVASWVDYLNEKHKPAPEPTLDAPVVEPPAAEPVTEPKEEVVDKPAEPVVD